MFQDYYFMKSLQVTGVTGTAVVAQGKETDPPLATEERGVKGRERSRIFPATGGMKERETMTHMIHGISHEYPNFCWFTFIYQHKIPFNHQCSSRNIPVSRG